MSTSTATGQNAPQQESQQQASSSNTGGDNPFWKPHTSNNRTQQCRGRTLHHQHQRNRDEWKHSTTKRSTSGSLRVGGAWQYGLDHRRRRTHRVQTPLHPTVSAQRLRANPEDQHDGQPIRHPHKVRCNRDALAASQPNPQAY